MAQFSLFQTSLGPCGIAWAGGRVIATSLPEACAADTRRRLAGRSGGSEQPAPPAIARVIDAMTALLAGQRTDLTFVDCDLSGIDPFAVRVYGAARGIPAGRTATYGEIAEGLGDRRLARNVGQALGRNPLPIIVPCHRVLGADGKLVGFSAEGGVALKLKMLDIEGAQPGGVPGLFDDLPLAVKPA